MDQSYKTFFIFTTYKWARRASVLVTGKLFQPSILLTSKASGIGKDCQGQIFEFNSPICKLRKIQKSFITLDPGCTSPRVSIINLFTVLTDTSTKDDLKQPRSHTICWQGFQNSFVVCNPAQTGLLLISCQLPGVAFKILHFFATTNRHNMPECYIALFWVLLPGTNTLAYLAHLEVRKKMKSCRYSPWLAICSVALDHLTL